MPSTSVRQHNFFEMIAHDPAKARQAGVPVKVGKDFVAADKARVASTPPGQKAKRLAHLMARKAP